MSFIKKNKIMEDKSDFLDTRKNKDENIIHSMIIFRQFIV